MPTGGDGVERPLIVVRIPQHHAGAVGIQQGLHAVENLLQKGLTARAGDENVADLAHAAQHGVFVVGIRPGHLGSGQQVGFAMIQRGQDAHGGICNTEGRFGGRVGQPRNPDVGAAQPDHIPILEHGVLHADVVDACAVAAGLVIHNGAAGREGDGGMPARGLRIAQAQLTVGAAADKVDPGHFELALSAAVGTFDNRNLHRKNAPQHHGRYRVWSQAESTIP